MAKEGTKKIIRISDAELRMLRAIRDHIQRWNIAPTYEELSERVRRSKSVVRHTIARLIEKEMITRAPGRFRNLVVTNAGRSIASRVRK